VLRNSRSAKAEILDGIEGPDPQQLFLQRADEAFGASVSLRGSDEGGRALEAEKAHLSLEGVGPVLRAVVEAEGWAVA
jgi:hypothetical protein